MSSAAIPVLFPFKGSTLHYQPPPKLSGRFGVCVCVCVGPRGLGVHKHTSLYLQNMFSGPSGPRMPAGSSHACMLYHLCCKYLPLFSFMEENCSKISGETPSPCLCVCERERERENERQTIELKLHSTLSTKSSSKQASATSRQDSGNFSSPCLVSLQH